VSEASEAELYRLEQASVLIEAYEDRFGSKPETPGDFVAALDAGLLDNLPKDEHGHLDVAGVAKGSPP